jgi:hypothetical protein
MTSRRVLLLVGAGPTDEMVRHIIVVPAEYLDDPVGGLDADICRRRPTR